MKVVLACRSDILGEEAASSLRDLGFDVEYRNLDISDDANIERFAFGLSQKYDKLDVLVGNAAIAMADASVPLKDRALQTIKVNYFGTAKVVEALLPLLRKSEAPRIVTVASQLGLVANLGSEELKERFRATDTIADVDALMNEFVAAVSAGTHEAQGWTDNPYTTYSVSKVGVLGYSRALAKRERELNPAVDFRINAVCPGYCSTDLNGHSGPRSPADGATCPVNLALGLGEKTTGKFFADDLEVLWETAPLPAF